MLYIVQANAHLSIYIIISQSLSTKRHFHLVTQVFRAVNHLSPTYLWHSFQLAKKVAGRLNTPHVLGMTIICISHLLGLTMGKIYSFYYQGAASSME